jgi:hypothetical protein
LNVEAKNPGKVSAGSKPAKPRDKIGAFAGVARLNSPRPSAPVCPARRFCAGLFVLAPFSESGYRPRMPDDEKLTPADPKDIADTIAFSLRFEGRKRVHDADAFMASIVAQRVVRHLERCGFVLMKRPPIGGSALLHVPEGWPHTPKDRLR